MKVAIIDYGSGNLHSAEKAFERAARDAGIDAEILVTGNPDDVANADRVVLPGVGAFRDCKAGLFAVDGMVDALRLAVETRARPFFGICVGMQLMATRGLEHGEESGFGWIGGDISLITPNDPNLKIPHMGWNTLVSDNPHPVTSGIELGPEGLHAYFVHSYVLAAENPGEVLCHTEYGGAITAMVGRDNMIGTQFHPEKSQQLGLRMIANFLTWTP